MSGPNRKVNRSSGPPIRPNHLRSPHCVGNNGRWGMTSPDELQQQVFRICSENPPATVFYELWRLAEKESHEAVLGAIPLIPIQAHDWLKEAIGFYDDDGDDRPFFYAASLVGGEVVECCGFPKSWLDEVRKVLMPARKRNA